MSSRWRATILVQRVRIASLLEDAPSLRRRIEPELAKQYSLARLAASGETGLPETAFPPECPYSVERTLDPEFLPE
jgi:hypothetical protein